jgi:hypothetical protein
MINRRDFLLASGAAVLLSRTTLSDVPSEATKTSVSPDPTRDFYYVGYKWGWIFDVPTEKIDYRYSETLDWSDCGPIMTRILIRHDRSIRVIWSPSFDHANATESVASLIVEQLINKAETPRYFKLVRTESVPIATVAHHKHYKAVGLSTFEFADIDYCFGPWRLKEVEPYSNHPDAKVKYVRKGRCIIPCDQPVAMLDPETFMHCAVTGEVEIAQAIVFRKFPKVASVSPLAYCPVCITDTSKATRVLHSYEELLGL